MKLPKQDQRVMITGLYAGMFSQHVCVIPDVTDSEILDACNAEEIRVNPESTHRWTIVIRTEEDAKRANVNFTDGKPVVCVECPPRIHYVVR